MIAVVDTSAVLRLFLPDGPIPEGMERLFRELERGRHTALAPELMLAEVGNVANKKRKSGVLSADEAGELVRLVAGLPIVPVSHRDLIEPALALAEIHDLTVYDALFLALARRQSAVLFTADDRLAETARQLGLG